MRVPETFHHRGEERLPVVVEQFPQFRRRLVTIPLSLDRHVDTALVIGLGSGITAGTLATSG